MKFVLATAVAVASLNLVLGSRQLRELSSCQQELRRLQCMASTLPEAPGADAFETSNHSTTTTTTAAAENTTTSAATMAPSRRLALCRRRLSQCQANLPAAEPATTAAPTASAAAASATETAKPEAPAADSKASTDEKCCSASMESGKTLLDLAKDTPDLSKLVSAITTKTSDPTSLTSTLGGKGPLTVMAPNNAAFKAAEPVASKLTKDQFTELIKYHVIPGGAFCASDLANGTQQVKTALDGCDLTVVKDSSGITVNGNKVVGADVCASNGVAHVVDGVLLPPKDASSCKFYDVKPSGEGGGGDEKNTTTTEPMMVGGCKGTQFGCCPDDKTAKKNANDKCDDESPSTANATSA